MVEDLLRTLGAALVGAILGTGGILALLRRGIKDLVITDMKPIYARNSQLKGVADKVDGLEKKVDRMVNLLNGINDRQADFNERVGKAEGRIEEVDKHGSGPMRGMQNELHKIQLLLAKITTHMGIEEE